MFDRKCHQEVLICLYCSHEIVLLNNDKQFSWDLHKQENYHIRARQKGKKKMNVKENNHIHITKMKTMFVSSSNIQKWANELIRLADIQLSKDSRNAKVVVAIARLFSSFYLEPFEVVTFGSRITGLTTTDSGDLDVFVDTSENEQNLKMVDNPELENWALRKASDIMKQKEKDEWANAVPVLTCRTPILKAIHYETKMQCDITVMNGLGTINTQLMCLYLRNIPKLRPLILIIREWSAECDFAKDINNYALSLLVLFYLQHDKYAPPVCDFEFCYTEPRKQIAGYDCINYEDVNFEWTTVKRTDNVHLRTLLLGFFSFYSTFDFRNDVVCPLLGTPVKIKFFAGNGKKLPAAMWPYVSKLQSGGESFKLSNRGINIQDPIDMAHNLTKSTKEQFIYDFVDMCDSARQVLESLN